MEREDLHSFTKLVSLVTRTGQFLFDFNNKWMQIIHLKKSFSGWKAHRFTVLWVNTEFLWIWKFSCAISLQGISHLFLQEVEAFLVLDQLTIQVEWNIGILLWPSKKKKSLWFPLGLHIPCLVMVVSLNQKICVCLFVLWIVLKILSTCRFFTM